MTASQHSSLRKATLLICPAAEYISNCNHAFKFSFHVIKRVISFPHDTLCFTEIHVVYPS